MSQGAHGGLTRQKSRQSRKNEGYYKSGFNRVHISKLKREAARKRWLSRRQSAEVLLRMAKRWCERHPVDYSKLVCTVYRYGCPVLINTKEKPNA